MTSLELNTRFVEVVDQELGVIDQFLSVLLREENALKQGDIETLHTLLPEKNRLIELVECASKARQAFADSAWDEHETMKNLLSAKAATVKTQHEINAKLLNLLMKDVSNRLDALRQIRGGQMVYGADGVQQSFGISRISESA